jgi:hypothetical protein
VRLMQAAHVEDQAVVDRVAGCRVAARARGQPEPEVLRKSETSGESLCSAARASARSLEEFLLLVVIFLTLGLR